MITATRRRLVVGLTLAIVLAACGSASPSRPAAAPTIRLLTHDSFVLSDGLLADFTKQTGIKVKLIQGGVRFPPNGPLIQPTYTSYQAPQHELLLRAAVGL